MSTPKIYAYCLPAGHPWGERDVIGYAIAEDGVCLATHLSSSAGFSRHDMGIAPSEWQHEHYREHYPDGYELEWINTADLDSHAGFQAAYALNQRSADAPLAPQRDPGVRE